MAAEPLLPSSVEGPDLDVLVVGGGPVGILAAIELASRGCKVRIIDLNEAPVQMTKASGIAARSLEVLPSTVVDAILSYSCHLQKARLMETAKDGSTSLLAELKMDAIRGYHGMRSQQQHMTEKMLNDYLQTLPDHQGQAASLRVERGVKLINFTETANGVQCELQKGGDGSFEIDAKFLLACDGGSSSVRKMLGASFDGEATAEYFFALHAAFNDCNAKSDEMVIFCSQRSGDLGTGFAFAMPMPDGGFLITLDLDDDQQKQWKTGELDRHGLPVLRQPSPDDVASVLRERGFGNNLSVKPGTVKWIAHFRVNSRQTSSYGKGRVYLAGDACHCHSPLGGQGMNMGFQDAKNIAWKLAWCAKGGSPHSLLASYEAERMGLEKKICHAIEVAQKAMSTRNPVAMFIRSRGQRIGPALLQLTGKDKSVLGVAAQTAWSYAATPLCIEHWERPPLTLASICPAGGLRRRQNLFRWIGSRVRAGDSVPDAPSSDGGTVQETMKAGKGFTILLFEGQPEANADNERLLTNAKTLSVEQLHAMGNALKSAPLANGFMKGVDGVLVFPWATCQPAHDEFGVRGQCLFLVRPDFHVALRSEPIRAGVVVRYLKDTYGADTNCQSGNDRAPASAPYFDWLPVTVWGCVAGALSLWYVGDWVSSQRPGPLHSGILAFSWLVLTFIYIASKPPR